MKDKIIKFQSNTSINLTSELSAILAENPGPFNRFSGFTFTPVSMSQDAPHGGEMHPDGDEIIFVFSGSMEVTLEFEKVLVVHVAAGEGIVIPKGVWHKVHVIEPVNLATVSPGPGFEFRALEQDV
jgi:mannose-6-phosphate isomerase-like protein (cupin superfamily)